MEVTVRVFKSLKFEVSIYSDDKKVKLYKEIIIIVL